MYVYVCVSVCVHVRVCVWMCVCMHVGVNPLCTLILVSVYDSEWAEHNLRNKLIYIEA